MSDDDDDTRFGASEPRILVGASACLLGERVRHDGSHKRNAFLVEDLARHLRFVPFCPELSAGLGTPRPTLRLIGKKADQVRLVEPVSGLDRTALLEETSAALAERAAKLCLSGFILKSASPSCGMERVRVYAPSGVPQKIGAGLFARALRKRLPHLPIEEEGRLCDARLRECFLLRVFTHFRFTTTVKQTPSVHALIRFHAAHKLVLLAHDERRVREMGRLVAHAKERPLDDVLARYEDALFKALAKPATREQHQNALHHAAGFLKDRLDDTERRQLHDVIVRHGKGELPLIVPLTLLRVFQARSLAPYLGEQVYLEPLPPELGLYNQL